MLRALKTCEMQFNIYVHVSACENESECLTRIQIDFGVRNLDLKTVIPKFVTYNVLGTFFSFTVDKNDGLENECCTLN